VTYEVGALGRWPGLIPGVYPCGNCAGTVVVDGDAVAVCNNCSTPSEALLTALGFRKLPSPLRVERSADQGAVGGTDNPQTRRPIPPPRPPAPEGPGGRTLRL
jgi:hypothetical protein